MPRFAYDATDASGAPAKGELEAADRRGAARQLAARGWRVSRLTEVRGPSAPSVAEGGADHPALHRARPFGVHPSAQAFVRGFHDLHEGGMPVGDAVKLMSVRVSEPALRALCRGLWADLSEGMPLSAALAKRPVVFDEAVVHLVAAGESTGGLAPVLARVLRSYETREALRARVIGALAYPVFVCLLATAVLAMFVFVIMPRMEGMMRALGGEFPWPVKAVMAAAVVAVKGSPLFVALAVFAAYRLRKARAAATARLAQDAMALRLPMLGRALVHAEAARVAELLSTLLGSGVNAAQALKLAEKPVANASLRARFTEARRRVNDGASISTALGETGMFESEDIDLAAVGENAGTLPRAFASVAERRRRALDESLNRMVRVLTGVFLGFAVGLVFFCLVSIVTTIMSVSQNISAHR